MDYLYACTYHVAISSEMTLKWQQFELFFYQYANSLMIYFIYIYMLISWFCLVWTYFIVILYHYNRIGQKFQNLCDPLPIQLFTYKIFTCKYNVIYAYIFKYKNSKWFSIKFQIMIMIQYQTIRFKMTAIWIFCSWICQTDS